VPPRVSSAEVEVRDAVAAYFCRMADTIGLPRSVAQIYAVLFLSGEPLSFGDIVETSGLSKASASTGLKFLERMRGAEIVVVPDDRRTFYRAELSVRRLVAGFVQESLQPGLDAGQRLLDQAAAVPDAGLPQILTDRLASLRTWHGLTRDLLPALAALENAESKGHGAGSEILATES
jgi:DNA-binding transcriptional regulator GbsR (MarR family)